LGNRLSVYDTEKQTQTNFKGSSLRTEESLSLINSRKVGQLKHKPNAVVEIVQYAHEIELSDTSNTHK